MEKLELLEKRFEALIRVIRILLSLGVIFAGLDSLYELSKVGMFKKMFVTAGEELPALSILLFNNSQYLFFFVLIVMTAPLVIAFFKKQAQWPLVLLLVSAIFLYFFTKLITLVMHLPLFQMLNNLSG